MDTPENGLTPADDHLDRASPYEDNTKETTNQKSEKVSVSSSHTPYVQKRSMNKFSNIKIYPLLTLVPNCAHTARMISAEKPF